MKRLLWLLILAGALALDEVLPASEPGTLQALAVATAILISAAISAVAAGASTAASIMSQPDFSSLASSTKEGIQADFDTLGTRRGVEMASRLGIKWTDPSTGQVHDFTGGGDAQRMAKEARMLTERILEIQKTQGPEFLEEQLKQLRAADPEGWEARTALYDTVMADIQASKEQNRPVADLLQAQLSQELGAGAALTPEQRQDVTGYSQSALADRGGQSELDFVESLEQGFAGEQRAAQRQGATTAWLGSGATPEDVSYRRRQQGQANLAAFAAGRTPQAQFGQLSGAQYGPVPFYQAPGLPNVNPQAGQQGAAYGSSMMPLQAQAAAQQGSNWMTGISLVLQGAGAAGQMGAF